MWKLEYQHGLVKLTWSRSREGELPALRSASFHSNPAEGDSFEIIVDYNDGHRVYRTKLKPKVEAKLRASLLNDGFSYGVDIAFSSWRRMAGLAEDAISNYMEMLDANADDWLAKRLRFFDDPTGVFHRCASELEWEEGQMAAEIERLKPFVNQPQDRETLAYISHVQRGRIAYVRPLEIGSTCPLLDTEKASLRPYLVAVLESLPPLEPPFRPNREYVDSVAML